jgi:hypothetical protein
MTIDLDQNLVASWSGGYTNRDTRDTGKTDRSKTDASPTALSVGSTTSRNIGRGSESARATIPPSGGIASNFGVKIGDATSAPISTNYPKLKRGALNLILDLAIPQVPSG